MDDSGLHKYKLKHINGPLLGECMALWGEPNEPSIQHHAGLHVYDIASYLYGSGKQVASYST